MNRELRMENGKILWFLLLPILLFANVEVFVNKKVLVKGEPLIISIKADGKDIKFPKIDNVAGYRVVSGGTSTNMQIINGKISESQTKQLVIYPDKNLTLPSFKVEVNGKVYKTKPIKVEVVKPAQTKGKFELDMNISKSSLYLGESSILTLKFKEDVRAHPQSIEIEAPKIEGFLLKKISQRSYREKNYRVSEYKFLIIPQKVGNFEVGPVVARVGYLVKSGIFSDPFFNVADIRYKNIYSNTLKVEVNPIPANSIYGDFNISLSVDNEKIKANTPNRAVLKISGCGDFSSLNDFKLNTDATVYKNKPVKRVHIENGKMCGEFLQTFTLLSDSNYSIKPIKLLTFNGKLREVSTKPVKVEVYGAPKRVAKEVIYKEKDYYVNLWGVKIKIESGEEVKKFLIISAVLGVVVGIVLGLLLGALFGNPLKYLFRCNLNINDKDLYAKLLPYANREEVKEVLKLLEENIYKKANHKIERKKLKKYIC